MNVDSKFLKSNTQVEYIRVALIPDYVILATNKIG